MLGTGTLINGGPNGFRILHNFFNNIYEQGIEIGSVELNATGYNIFYDVGNHFNGVLSPSAAIIVFGNSNNISVGDLFERSDDYATIHPRVDVGNTSSIGFVNGKFIELGPNVIESESPTTLTNNSSNQTFYTFDATLYRSISIDYSITRDTSVRHGTIRVVPTGGGSLTYDDDYVENATTGVTFSVSQSGDDVDVKYTTTNTGINGSLTYSISKFRV